MEKRYGPDKPHKTKAEYDKAFENCCKVIAQTLKITIDQARVRQYALIESGLLNDYDPKNLSHQMAVDLFLTDPAWDKQPNRFANKKY